MNQAEHNQYVKENKFSTHGAMQYHCPEHGFYSRGLKECPVCKGHKSWDNAVRSVTIFLFSDRVVAYAEIPVGNKPTRIFGNSVIECLGGISGAIRSAGYKIPDLILTIDSQNEPAPLIEGESNEHTS